MELGRWLKMKSLSEQLRERKDRKYARKGPQTPRLPYSEEVVLALKRLRTVQSPTLLQYTDVGQAYSPSACHLNVKHFAKIKGGRRVHGWVIWQFPNDYAEAEFHSVWEDERGNLVDITPHRNGQREIIFVRDDTLSIVREPQSGLDLLYPGVSSAVYPIPQYTIAGQFIDSERYTHQVESGSELDIAMKALGIPDLT